MTLPPSFQREGFVSPALTRSKVKLKNGLYLKPLLIGTEGQTDTGKTEFALSIPGNIQMLCIDRNYSGVFDNPNPPECRNGSVAIRVFEVPLEGQAKMPQYVEYFTAIRTALYNALANQDSQVVVIDGDSDFWEIEILAYFGKTTQIYPQTRYAAPYAEKRAQICKMHDSGKVVLASNKVKDQYKKIWNADGTPKLDPVTGDQASEKTGDKERAGFKDQDYLWNIQLRHMVKPKYFHEKLKKMVPTEWGIQVLKCKHNMDMVGAELWGSQCNFRGLVDLVYPDVDPKRWGFAE